MVTKIIIPSIIILVIFFILKKNIEKFEASGTLELSFNSKDSVFLVSKNLEYIEQSVLGTTIHQTKNLIYSNDTIYSDSGEFTGFLFSIKPDNKIKIGFSNLEEDKKDEIAHSIDVLGDNTIQITERIKGTKQYLVQDIDFCASGPMDECLKTKNKFTFNPLTDYLSIVFNKGKVNYLIVKRNSDGELGSMLIHRSNNPVNFPYRLKVVPVDKKCLLPAILWTKHRYIYDSPVYWSVETSFKDDYDSKVLDLVPMESQEQEVIPAPSSRVEVEEDIDLAKYFTEGIRKILIRDVSIDGEYYKMEFRHNIDDLYIKLNKDRIFLKLYLDEDTYIFKKYPTIENIEMFRLNQPIVAIEIVIGDVISHKYFLEETNIRQIQFPNTASPAPN